jgi:hypothetical protein
MRVLTFTLFFLFAVSGFAAAQKDVPHMEKEKARECQKLFQEIKYELKAGNFCEKDADCRAVAIPEAHQESFGCKEYLNQKVDAQPILNKMEQYKNECGKGVLWMQGACFAPEGVVCNNKKCAPKMPENLPAEAKEPVKEAR